MGELRGVFIIQRLFFWSIILSLDSVGGLLEVAAGQQQLVTTFFKPQFQPSRGGSHHFEPMF